MQSSSPRDGFQRSLVPLAGLLIWERHWITVTWIGITFNTFASHSSSVVRRGVRRNTHIPQYLALGHLLVQNNYESCGGIWLVNATLTCDGELLIGWNWRVVAWLGCDQYMTTKEWCDHCNCMFHTQTHTHTHTLILTGLSYNNMDPSESSPPLIPYFLTCYKRNEYWL